MCRLIQVECAYALHYISLTHGILTFLLVSDLYCVSSVYYVMTVKPFSIYNLFSKVLSVV